MPVRRAMLMFIQSKHQVSQMNYSFLGFFSDKVSVALENAFERGSQLMACVFIKKA